MGPAADAAADGTLIPRRFRNWILFWTPVVWLVLELVKYPQDLWWSAGAGAMLKGFFSAERGRVPGLGHAARRRRRRSASACWAACAAPRPSAFDFTLIAMGVVFVVWAFLAGGGASGWSAGANDFAYNWVLQTVLVVMGGVAAWFWAAGNPERAELLVWNTHQVWRLYRGNWQGMVGLGILVVFLGMALLAPFLIDHGLLDPNAQISDPATGELLGPFHPPTWYWPNLFGTDQVGQSVLAQFIWSARISLIVGLLAALVSTVVGAGIGIGAGYYGGWRGEVGMRLTDAFLVIPWLPLAMVLSAAWGQNYGMIILIIGITSWPGTARVVRSDTLRVRELQFIERARAIGSTGGHIMTKHILPNVMPLIFANLVLVVAIAILSRDHAVVPRARRSAQVQLGHDAALRLDQRRRRSAGLVVPAAAGHRDRARRARLHVHRHGLRRGARSQAAQA